MRLLRRDEIVIMALFVSIMMIVAMGASCGVKSTGSQPAQQIESKPRETPVPLQPTKANQGKRCAPRVYADVGQDEDYNPFCHELQRRLVKAAHEGNLVEMRAALSDGANADGSIYYFYYPPLFTAVDAGQSDAIRLLLDNGANVNQGDSISGTPLIVAAGSGHTEVVKILLERGADSCFKADGGTAEEVAQKRGYKEIVDLLKSADHANCK